MKYLCSMIPHPDEVPCIHCQPFPEKKPMSESARVAELEARIDLLTYEKTIGLSYGVDLVQQLAQLRAENTELKRIIAAIGEEVRKMAD